MNNQGFVWKDYKLYYKGKLTGTELIPVMFRVKTSKGESQDIYNISRAKQHGKDLTSEDMQLECGLNQ